MTSKIRRSSFLAIAAAPLLAARAAAQSDVDPAVTSSSQALRVMLGNGDASPVSSDSFTFDGRIYRGTFERDEHGAVVNVVDLEQYLYSVVSREMPPSWPPAALEAQAVCARTYVLQRSDPQRSYDLVPSELDQVYYGISSEMPNGIAAVDATHSLVLTYGRLFALVAYSSCCGGHTESSADAWGNAPIAYLDGVACTWCSDSPNYRWQRSLGFDTIGECVGGPAAPLDRVTGLRVDAKDPSGRVRTFDIMTDRGVTPVAGGAFRRAVGTRELPSLLINDVAPDQSGVLLDGSGLGHGVGLCQWGARGMALAGRPSNDILTYYFLGTEIQRL